MPDTLSDVQNHLIPLLFNISPPNSEWEYYLRALEEETWPGEGGASCPRPLPGRARSHTLACGSEYGSHGCLWRSMCLTHAHPGCTERMLSIYGFLSRGCIFVASHFQVPGRSRGGHWLRKVGHGPYSLTLLPPCLWKAGSPLLGPAGTSCGSLPWQLQAIPRVWSTV